MNKEEKLIRKKKRIYIYNQYGSTVQCNTISATCSFSVGGEERTALKADKPNEYDEGGNVRKGQLTI